MPEPKPWVGGWDKGGEEGHRQRLGEIVLASAPCLWEQLWEGGDSGLESLKARGQEESFLVRAAGTSLGST